MRGRRRVAHEHDVVVRPCLAEHAIEIEPGRPAQVPGVAHQAVAAEIAGEDPLAGGDRLVRAHAVKAKAAPSRLRALDDEGRSIRIELVCVRPYPALRRLLEYERE